MHHNYSSTTPFVSETPLPRLLQDCHWPFLNIHHQVLLTNRPRLNPQEARRSNECRPAGRVDKLDGRIPRRLGQLHSPNAQLVTVDSLELCGYGMFLLGHLSNDSGGIKIPCILLRLYRMGKGWLAGVCTPFNGMFWHKVLSLCSLGWANNAQDYVLSVAVSHDGRWIVSGSKDRGLRQFSVCFKEHKNSGLFSSPFSLPQLTPNSNLNRSESRSILATRSAGMEETSLSLQECCRHAESE